MLFIISIACIISIGLICIALALKYFSADKPIPTNYDRVFNSYARVVEAIDNTRFKGAVYADGKTWTARSVNNRIIKVNSIVKIIGIDGVKLICEDKN